MSNEKRNKFVELLAGVDQAIAGWEKQLEVATEQLRKTKLMKASLEARLAANDVSDELREDETDV